jgi:hypothetical protein
MGVPCLGALFAMGVSEGGNVPSLAESGISYISSPFGQEEIAGTMRVITDHQVDPA